MILPAILILSTASAALPGSPGYLPPEVSADLYRPAFGTDGFATIPARAAPGPSAGLDLSYLRNPLMWTDGAGVSHPILSDALSLHLGPGLGIGPVWIGADLPLWLVMVGEGLPDGWSDAPSPGDPRLMVRLLPMAADAPLAAGVFGELILPAGAAARLGGDPGWSGIIGACGGWRTGAFAVDLNLFSRVRPAADLGTSSLDDGFGFALQTAWQATPDLSLTAEMTGETSFREAFDPLQTPAELLFAARWRQFKLGFGMGITSGVGTPALRVVSGIRAPRPLPAPAEDITM